MGLFKKDKQNPSRNDDDDDSIGLVVDFSDTVDDDYGDDDDDQDQDQKDSGQRQRSSAVKTKKTAKKSTSQRSRSETTQRATKQQRSKKSSKRKPAPERSTAKKSTSASPAEVKPENEYELAMEFLRTEGFDDDNGRPKYYRKRPKRTAREWWISTGYKSAVFVMPISLVMFGGGWISNQLLQNELSSQISSTYNPSLRERNADLGRSAIYAYYNGDPVPPVSIARGIAWPGGAESDQLDTLGGISGDAAESGAGVDSTVGTDASINATVRNLSLVRASNWEKQGTEDEIRNNPSLETSLVESLTYSGVFNGIVSEITIMLQTPGAKPADLINPSDSLQPPIMVSVPTITPGKPAVSGAPGTNDPGTMNGTFEPIRVIPEQVVKSVDSWAQAYAADDRRSLRDIIRDPQDGNYVGMIGGWSLKPGSVKTQWQYLRTSDNLMVVGVTFVATQAMLPEDDEDDPIVTDNPQMMELLIDYSNAGTPSIIAWGVSGSAQYLRPYQNAMADNEVPDSSNTRAGERSPVEINGDSNASDGNGEQSSTSATSSAPRSISSNQDSSSDEESAEPESEEPLY